MNDLAADVRFCTEADLPLLASHEGPQTAGFAARNLALAAAGDFYFVGAFNADDVMGHVALDCRPETDLAPEMRTLWVYPAFRRHGLGVQLTRFIEGIAADLGYESVQLGVDPENPAAIPMYIGLDYTPTGDHRLVTDGDGTELHEAIYRKSLKITR